MTLDGKADRTSSSTSRPASSPGTATTRPPSRRRSTGTSPPPAGTTYTVDVPAGTEVETIGDTDAYEASPAAAGRTAGYAPLVSDLAPDGYALKAVATVARRLRRPYAGPGIRQRRGSAGRPPREPVIASCTRAASAGSRVEQVGPKATRCSAPTSAGLAGRDRPTSRLSLQQTTLQYGALKGATASTWYQESGPSLFASGRAPGGLRHRRAHPPGADRVRRGAEARRGAAE